MMLCNLSYACIHRNLLTSPAEKKLKIHQMVLLNLEIATVLVLINCSGNNHESVGITSNAQGLVIRFHVCTIILSSLMFICT